MIVSQKINFKSDAELTDLEAIGGFAGTISKLPLGFPLLPLR